jgi:2-hydroxychromene-2-carboxylate isomerase
VTASVTASVTATAITVYIDFKSPQAYLALKPTLQLAAEENLEIHWLPYRSKQPTIVPQQENETRGESHVRVRQQQRHQTCLKYAAIQNMPMVFPAVPGSTDCALAALLSVNAEPLEFIRAAFEAYWRQGLDLDNAAVVAELLVASGCDAERFAAADSATTLAEFQASAEELGVFDTPMYLLDDQLFLGREQLPWIKSLLN